jgi:hypothetical protein
MRGTRQPAVAVTMIATGIALVLSLASRSGAAVLSSATQSEARPSLSRAAGTDTFATETVELFSKLGVSAEVPRGPRGNPLTRYEFAAITHHLITLLYRDMRETLERLEAIRMDAAPMPRHLEDGKTLLQWLTENARSRGSEGVTSWTVDLAAEHRAAREAEFNFTHRPITFRDVPLAHRARALVTLQTRRGLFEGFPDGTFRGEQPITSAEFALVCRRIGQEVQHWMTGGFYLQRGNEKKPPLAK